MPKNPQRFADLLGAKLVGQIPDIGSGPFGMARLARIMHRRSRVNGKQDNLPKEPDRDRGSKQQ